MSQAAEHRFRFSMSDNGYTNLKSTKLPNKVTPRGNESIEVQITLKYRKRTGGTLTEKMKRSSDKRHTQTQGNLIEIF